MTLQEGEQLVRELTEKGILRNQNTLRLLTQKLSQYLSGKVKKPSAPSPPSSGGLLFL